MATYRVKKYFMYASQHVSIEFNINSKWQYLGFSERYIILYRNGVFIDIPKDVLERNFVELKEQKINEQGKIF